MSLRVSVSWVFVMNLVRVREAEDLVGAVVYRTNAKRASTTRPLSSSSELSFF